MLNKGIFDKIILCCLNLLRILSIILGEEEIVKYIMLCFIKQNIKIIILENQRFLLKEFKYVINVFNRCLLYLFKC